MLNNEDIIVSLAAYNLLKTYCIAAINTCNNSFGVNIRNRNAFVQSKFSRPRPRCEVENVPQTAEIIGAPSELICFIISM